MEDSKERPVRAHLLIRYRDSSGSETERRISSVEVFEGDYLTGDCDLREARRTFKISRVISAVDLSTGEEIEDIYAFFGLAHPKPPSPIPIPTTTQEAKAQRKREKWGLYREYGLEVVRDHITRSFFRLFRERCYKCGNDRYHELVMDHHVAITRGGHFEPGNLVALCITCNTKKSDKPPETFYTPEELDGLQPLLDQETSVFSFRFDWHRWFSEKGAYLISLGIDPLSVQQALCDDGGKYARRTSE